MRVVGWGASMQQRWGACSGGGARRVRLCGKHNAHSEVRAALTSMLTHGPPAQTRPPTRRRRSALLKMEEEWIQRTCEQIAAFKPDVVITGGCICCGALACLLCRRRAVALLCGEPHLAPPRSCSLPSPPATPPPALHCLRVSREGAVRPGGPLSDEGGHHRHPAPAQDGQQPHRAGLRRHHRQQTRCGAAAGAGLAGAGWLLRLAWGRAAAGALHGVVVGRRAGAHPAAIAALACWPGPPPTACRPPLPRPCSADEIRESDIGTGAGLFEVRKIGDEFYTFIVDCKVGGWVGWLAAGWAGRLALRATAGALLAAAPRPTHVGPAAPCPPRLHHPRAQDPKACSIVLRGASKDVLNEVERNLHDAMGVARNVCIGAPPLLLPLPLHCCAVLRWSRSLAGLLHGLAAGAGKQKQLLRLLHAHLPPALPTATLMHRPAAGAGRRRGGDGCVARPGGARGCGRGGGRGAGGAAGAEQGVAGACRRQAACKPWPPRLCLLASLRHPRRAWLSPHPL